MNNQNELVERFFVLNGSIYPIHDYNYTYPNGCKVLYEVIRVKESSPLFFEWHLNRLYESVKLLEFDLPDKETLIKIFLDLLVSNPIKENNVKISLVYSSKSNPDILINFVPSKYPTEIQLHSGVEMRTVNATRDNPNIKIQNIDLREKTDSIIKYTGCYEVLLANNEGKVTEGSRSNIFFIKGKTVLTPPVGMVLNGITRQLVIQICNEHEIPLEEELIPVDKLSYYSSAFITGTSPGILPVNSIDYIKFMTQSSIVKDITERYNQIIKNDIQNWKQKYLNQK